MFTKDAVVVYLFIYKDLLSLFPVLLTKDCSPCLLLFIYKGPWPLCCGIHSQRTAVLVLAIHLQRTAVLVFAIFICKGPLSLSGAIYLQRTVVLVQDYPLAKDRHPCLMLFICKGPRYLFCAISLQRKLLFLLSICCPGKIDGLQLQQSMGKLLTPQGL